MSVPTSGPLRFGQELLFLTGTTTDIEPVVCDNYGLDGLLYMSNNVLLLLLSVFV